jgi:hypothetical protein
MRYVEILSHLKHVSEEHYVLHGSPHHATTLEPRQTEYDSHKEFAQFGLYGTPYVEIALLYALIHESRGEWGWAIGGTPTNPKFYVHVFEGFSSGSGYVHILDRTLFSTIRKSHGQVAIARASIPVLESLSVDEEVLQELLQKDVLEFVYVDRPGV